MANHVTLLPGDCLLSLRMMADNSVDSIVTDPPYGLSKGPDMAEVLRHWLAGDDYQHKGGGFMGKTWDSFVPGPAVWREALRVLKPGGHLLAFFGTRTQDMGTLAIRLAGFEIRDSIAWVYGSGFPKSMDVSKAIDKMGGQPWGEFAGLLDRLIKGAGYNYTSLDRALGIASSGSNSCYWVRTDERGGLPPRHYYELLKKLLSPPKEFTDLYDEAEREVIAIERRKNAPSGIVAAGRESVEIERQITAPATDSAHQWEGWGTALKPALEPITVARKPLIGTVAANVLEHGTGAINIDACRIGGDDGRWPANLIHDGSDEVVALFPVTTSGAVRAGTVDHGKEAGVLGGYDGRAMPEIEASTGSAARFFYCAKASRKDRHEGLDDPGAQFQRGTTLRQVENTATTGNNHPTVKPTDLMAYLCRLVTPPGGTVLDPFMGSGSTGKAAIREGFNFIGCELSPEYLEIARARISAEENL